MITTAEIEFLDKWFRENWNHEWTGGYAMTLCRERGINYDHIMKIAPFYHKSVPEGYWDAETGPPTHENQSPECPWKSVVAFESRLQELKQLNPGVARW